MKRAVRWVVGRWTDSALRTKGLLVLAIPVTALVALAAVGLIVDAQLDSVTSQTSQTESSIAKVDRGQLLIVAAETGVRGYAATRDSVFLKPYTQALHQLRPLFLGRKDDPVISPSQNRTVKMLGLDEFKELGEIRAGVAAGTLTGNALETDLLVGKHYMDEIGKDIAAVQAHRLALLKTQQQDVANLQDLATSIDIAGLVVGVGGGVLAMLLFLSGIGRRVSAAGRNAERFGSDEPFEPTRPSRDEIGRLQAGLEQAAVLLTARQLDLRNARDEAVAATQAKDLFLSRMSHELRTPLTAVLGFGQLLQLEDLGKENADSVDAIVKAGQHLLDLINDVLDIAQIETGHLSLSLEPVLVGALVDDAVGLLRPLAAARQLGVVVQDLSGVPVAADHQRLKQVLLNLLSNAIKYNREQGRIVVSRAAGSAGCTRIAVADTGLGISEASLGRLFNPFDRMDAARGNVGGSGVGLSLSKSLVEAMGGVIGVESVVGEGSTFWVELPDADPGREIPPPPVAAGYAGYAGTTGRAGTVLYVEDNLASLRVVERIFHKRQESLQVAVQGGMALDLARQLQPRMILLDLHLPDMSGEEALQQLRSDPATSSIPVVILSADASSGRRRRLLDQGASAFLSKPIDIPELLTLLDTYGAD